MDQVCQLYKYNKNDQELIRGDEQYFLDSFDIRDLDQESYHWLNFHRITEKDTLAKFWDKQGFHKLTYDDIYTEKLRPKLEDFDKYIFFSIQSVLPGGDKTLKDLNREQLSFILGENYLISFQERSSDHFPEVRTRLEDKIGRIRQRKVDFLLFSLLDAIVDNYFELLDEFKDVINDMELEVVQSADQEILSTIETHKRNLIELRKIVTPLKDMAVQLEKVEVSFIEHGSKHYFSDLKDNCMSILDEIDGDKQILEGLTNLYYAAQGQRMNEIMKILTIVSAIFIPLTFIAGIYGMNFENMPELKSKNGYFIVWGVMAAITVILLLLFFKRGWLKRK